MKILSPICRRMSIRLKRRFVATVYHSLIVGIALLGLYLGLDKLSAALLVADILTFRIVPVSRWLEEKLITEAVCYNCGAAIEMVGLFKCGCGFLSWKERHVFSPCPMCGKHFNWIICPECETTIPT